MSSKSKEIVGELRWYADFYEGSALSLNMHRAADLIEQLQQELIDERYRHDRVQDFCVAQGEELNSRIKTIQALLDGKGDFEFVGLPKED